MGAKQSSANVTFSKPGASANKSGYIWVAPLGTAIPADATTELDAAFVGLGYLSEDGLTEPASLTAGDDIVAAGGDTVAQADPTFSKTWTGTCIEVFDSGNPDNSAEGDLGAVNKVMLRTEVAIGWGFIGGTSKFYAITHATA